MRSRLHSRNWIPFLSSRPRLSWASSWKLDSHSHSDLTAVPAGRRCLTLSIDSQALAKKAALPQARLVSRLPTSGVAPASMDTPEFLSASNKANPVVYECAELIKDPDGVSGGKIRKNRLAGFCFCPCQRKTARPAKHNCMTKGIDHVGRDKSPGVEIDFPAKPCHMRSEGGTKGLVEPYRKIDRAVSTCVLLTRAALTFRIHYVHLDHALDQRLHKVFER